MYIIIHPALAVTSALLGLHSCLPPRPPPNTTLPPLSTPKCVPRLGSYGSLITHHSIIVKMDLLHSVFNHLTLPPNLPGAEDKDINAVSDRVLDRIICACELAAELAKGTAWKKAYEDLHKCLLDCRELNIGRLEKSTLLKHFRRLTPARPLILYVNEQNACLIIRQDIR